MQQPKSGKAAAAPCPGVPPVTGLNTSLQRARAGAHGTTQQEALGTHPNGTDSLTLLPSAADQDRGLLVENLYVYVQWRSRQQLGSGSLSSSCPWILTPAQPPAPRACEFPRPAAPLQLLVEDLPPHTHTSAQAHTLWIPSVTGLRHTEHPVAGPAYSFSPVASCTDTHIPAGLPVNPTPALSSSWPRPAGVGSGRQLLQESHLQKGMHIPGSRAA